jgi:hypothetical protein
MITEEDFRAIRESVNSGAICSATTTQLEHFAVALCHPHAFSFFGNNQFPQICETVRLHLLRAHIDTLQSHITKLDAQKRDHSRVGHGSRHRCTNKYGHSNGGSYSSGAAGRIAV